MSDVMFYGILRMPYEMAMEGEVSRRQFYSTAQTAADCIESLQAEIARMRAISNKLDGLKGSAYAYEVATPEKQAQIDALFAQMDVQIAARRVDRERRQLQQAYEGDDKRLQDRRKSPHEL